MGRWRRRSIFEQRGCLRVERGVYGSGIGLTNLPAQNLIQGPPSHSVVTVSASRVLGRGDSGAGAMQEITIGSV
jgi:hypothetical protein